MSEDNPFSEALNRAEKALCLAKYQEGFAQGRANRLRAEIKNALVLSRIPGPREAFEAMTRLLVDALKLDDEIAEQEKLHAQHRAQQRAEPVDNLRPPE